MTVIAGPDYIVSIDEPWITEAELKRRLSAKKVTWAKEPTQAAIRTMYDDFNLGCYLLTQVTKQMMLCMEMPPEIYEMIRESRRGADRAMDYLSEHPEVRVVKRG